MFAAAFGILILMHMAFGLAVLRRRNDIADVLWGPGFVVAGLAVVVARRGDWNIYSGLVLFLVFVWAFRLCFHIGTRFMNSSSEDPRYAQLRKDWGNSWVWQSYLKVFLLQGILMYIISTPFIAIVAEGNREKWGFVSSLGLVLWGIGFVIESIADRQLKTFKSFPENRGKLMTQGLWSWSRHPNYFGDSLQWWAVYLLAVPLDGGWKYIFSPLLMTFLLLKVTGVPPLEKMMKDRPGFDDYARKTSIFILWPPKK